MLGVCRLPAMMYSRRIQRTSGTFEMDSFTISSWQTKIAKAMVLACITTSFIRAATAEGTIPVADAPLSSTFYADGSCLLTVDSFVQPGKTVIDADVDEQGSRVLIHCDTNDGKRLTLLVRGESLNVAQREQLLTREAILEGESGLLAWLTRSGVNFTDDTAPRRYVIAGSVKMRKSPPADNVAGMAVHSHLRPFASVQGLLEPIIKSDSNITEQQITDQGDTDQGKQTQSIRN